MRICVVGPGAVGGNLAARLARSGVAVSVVARGAHLEAIRANGLRVVAGDETIEARVHASDDPRSLGPQDAVFVTVKAPALPAVAPQLLPLLGPDTPVVFTLNGIPWWYHLELARRGHAVRARLDPEGLLRDRIGLERTIGCIIYSSNEMLSPAVIRNHAAGGNRFVLGEPGGEASERCAALSALMTGAGLEAPVTTAIRTEIWKKLLLNIAVAGLCCLTGSNQRELAANAELRALCLAILAEGRAVAAAHKPSLLQDLELGRAMEIDAIFVAASDFARAADMATPVLDSIVALLRQRAAIAGLYQP